MKTDKTTKTDPPEGEPDVDQGLQWAFTASMLGLVLSGGFLGYSFAATSGDILAFAAGLALYALSAVAIFTSVNLALAGERREGYRLGSSRARSAAGLEDELLRTFFSGAGRDTKEEDEACTQK